MAPVRRIRTASFAVKVCMPGKMKKKKIALRVQKNLGSAPEKEENGTIGNNALASKYRNCSDPRIIVNVRFSVHR